jgi:hypothetical protein
MIVPTLAQIETGLLAIQSERPAGARSTRGRAERVERFRSLARDLALQTGSDAAHWQEAVLHQHRRLESAVSWDEIDPVALADALHEGDLSSAIATLRTWAAVFAGCVTAGLTDREMAILAVAAEQARDGADYLECGLLDELDPGPARIALPSLLHRVANGANVFILPIVFTEVLTQYCHALGWTKLALDDEVSTGAGIERIVAEGVRPAVIVFDWLRRRKLLSRLESNVNCALAALGTSLECDLHSV